MGRQTKAKCSNGHCLMVFPLDMAQEREIYETDGRKAVRTYCSLCADSEVIKNQQIQPSKRV